MIQHNETRTQHFAVFWLDTDKVYQKSYRELFHCLKPELYEDKDNFYQKSKYRARFLLTGHMAKHYTSPLTMNELLTFPKARLRRHRSTQPTWKRGSWWAIEVNEKRKIIKAGCDFWATQAN